MTTSHPQIAALNRLGQSVWYDNLSLDVLKSGELKRLVDLGVSGLTSNPAIFKKAIADTDNYNSQIANFVRAAKTPEEILEELMLADVGAAADLLQPIWERTGGLDGYASIEVSPLLARDPQATESAAHRLWTRLNRPNVMIKIPGTQEGLPAIRSVLQEGINVNVTLLFSVDRYQRVISEFLAAMEFRLKHKLPLSGIASVASFFVSRVDAICEKSFAAMAAKSIVSLNRRSEFYGKVGIANALVAYRAFLENFNSAQFQRLKSCGAQVQRPLWASTGTKNADFNSLLYVQGLVGPSSVNTMPPATLEALLASSQSFSDSLSKPSAEYLNSLNSLDSINIRLDSLLGQLEVDGVNQFADAHHALLGAVANKCTLAAKGVA